MADMIADLKHKVGKSMSRLRQMNLIGCRLLWRVMRGVFRGY